RVVVGQVEGGVREVVLEPVRQMQAGRDAGYRAVRRDRKGPAYADEVVVRVGELAIGTRGKDRDLVATPPQPGRQVTNVLGDPTRMRVVIRRHQADLHAGYPLANARTADRPIRAQLRPIR